MDAQSDSQIYSFRDFFHLCTFSFPFAPAGKRMVCALVQTRRAGTKIKYPTFNVLNKLAKKAQPPNLHTHCALLRTCQVRFFPNESSHMFCRFCFSSRVSRCFGAFRVSSRNVFHQRESDLNNQQSIK